MNAGDGIGGRGVLKASWNDRGVEGVRNEQKGGREGEGVDFGRLIKPMSEMVILKALFRITSGNLQNSKSPDR